MLNKGQCKTCTVCTLSEFRAWKSRWKIDSETILSFCALCERGHIDPLPCSPPQLCRQCGTGLYSVTPAPKFLDQPLLPWHKMYVLKTAQEAARETNLSISERPCILQFTCYYFILRSISKWWGGGILY